MPSYHYPGGYEGFPGNEDMVPFGLGGDNFVMPEQDHLMVDEADFKPTCEFEDFFGQHTDLHLHKAQSLLVIPMSHSA